MFRAEVNEWMALTQHRLRERVSDDTKRHDCEESNDIDKADRTVEGRRRGNFPALIQRSEPGKKRLESHFWVNKIFMFIFYCHFHESSPFRIVHDP